MKFIVDEMPSYKDECPFFTGINCECGTFSLPCTVFVWDEKNGQCKKNYDDCRHLTVKQA